MQHVSWDGSHQAEMIENLSRTQMIELIDEWIFSERDRAILKRRLLDGICYAKLAEEFELSERHVKTIVYKCENRLYSHLRF